jgi:hypothetical protein
VHFSPCLQAPILKKNEQLTLSSSVPNTLANLSAIKIKIIFIKILIYQRKIQISISKYI